MQSSSRTNIHACQDVALIRCCSSSTVAARSVEEADWGVTAKRGRQVCIASTCLLVNFLEIRISFCILMTISRDFESHIPRNGPKDNNGQQSLRGEHLRSSWPACFPVQWTSRP